jgi:hypothetical protein
MRHQPQYLGPRWIGRSGSLYVDWEVCCETAMRLVPAAATHELQDGQEDINCIEVDGK